MDFGKTISAIALVAGLLAADAPSAFAGGPRAGKRAGKAAPGTRVGLQYELEKVMVSSYAQKAPAGKKAPLQAPGAGTVHAAPQDATPSVQKVREAARRTETRAGSSVWIDIGLPSKPKTAPGFLRDVGDDIRALGRGGGQQRSGENSSESRPKRGLTIRIKDAAGREVEVTVNIGWPFGKKKKDQDEESTDERTDEESESGGDGPATDDTGGSEG